MNILMTGSSGLIGSALAPFLTNDGHQIIKLHRQSAPGRTCQPSWDPITGRIDLGASPRFDAVIHLAGETIAQRWTPATKARIRQSRVEATRLLVEALIRLPEPPKVLISASATGYYGDRGNEILNESSACGTGFLADVCRDWESSTRSAGASGMRVVNLRLGIVLTARGGALRKMLPSFRLGVGGKLGEGRQYWSWIALEDLLAICRHALIAPGLSGPVNAVSPQPVTNAEFTRTLGAILRRPTLFAVPRLVLKLLFGEMGTEAMLASCRAIPVSLERSGFVFRFSDLEAALRHLLTRIQ